MRLAAVGIILALLGAGAYADEGVLRYVVHDSDKDAPMPAKLTFVGTHGTPAPSFTKNDIGRQEGDAIAAWNRVMSLTGSGEIRLPAGTYDVWASRGPEWTATVIHDVRIGPKPATFTAHLSHVVDTRGWLSGDFHVHAATSPDSQVPMLDRIYEFASDGVELIVATDHNVVADYAPIIASLGVGRYIASATGDELTTNGWGHFGAFPLTPDLERAGQGAVLVHGRTAADFFADVRKAAPLAIIDVHHPRLDTEIGYFNLAHFNPLADHAERAGFSYDFDALEVLNGYQDSERKSVDRVIADWFGLLLHGHIVTATGNSDTHHLDHNIGGYPRNYVSLLEDDPGTLRLDEVTRAIRGHHTFFTTAPFVRVTMAGASGVGTGGGIGDLVRLPSGQTQLHVEVQAAPWVSVSTVTVYVDGKEMAKLPVPASTAALRLRTDVPIHVARDAFVVVRVDGDKPMSPIVGDLTRFDVRPLALTNPIFIDVDGNGRYDAPLKAKK